MSFCFIFQVRKPLFMVLCSAIGAISWWVYLLTEPLGSETARFFTATIVVSVLAEVLARVEAQLRRYKQFSGGGGSAVLTHGDLTLDQEGVTVTAAGKPVTVTAREFDILTLLMEHPKKVFTREQLYEQVWGGEYMGDDNTVNVHISNLRAKLAKASPAEYIKTVWGIGFKMSDL